MRAAWVTMMLVLLAGPAAAGAFEDGLSAWLRQDYATALRMWRPLADQGNANAQSILGSMYSNGQGVPKDYVLAVKWYRLAADQGDANAQSNLGYMYANGRGVPKDYVLAVKWYRLAADQGNASAQFALGAMYGNGRGVPKDYVLAYMWSNLGAAAGNELGNMNRDLFAAHMTPDDISEAQRLSREWKPK
jgi:hypothetical protein